MNWPRIMNWLTGNKGRFIYLLFLQRKMEQYKAKGHYCSIVQLSFVNFPFLLVGDKLPKNPGDFIT